MTKKWCPTFDMSQADAGDNGRRHIQHLYKIFTCTQRNHRDIKTFNILLFVSPLILFYLKILPA